MGELLTNKDGSVKLGTLRLETLFDLAVAQGVITLEQVAEFKGIITECEAKMAVIKTALDNKVKCLINPKLPASDVNIETVVKLGQLVLYIKRENPTATPSAKAQAKSAELAKRKSVQDAAIAELKAKLAAGEINTEQFTDLVIKAMA